MQSQELKGPDNALKKAEKDISNGGEEFSAKSTSQQIRRGAVEEAAYTAFDAMEHHKTFQKQQKAYNEVRRQYEEQAFSSGSSEPAVPSGTADAVPAAETFSGSSENPIGQPPPVNTGGSITGTGESAGSIGESYQNGAGGGSGVTGESSWKSPTMQEVEGAGRFGGLTYGTAESPKLAKNSQALLENEKLQEELESKRKYVQKGYTRFSLGEHATKEKEVSRSYGRLFDLKGEKAEKELVHFGRLKYSGRSALEKMTREDYEKLLNQKSRKSFRRRTGGRLLFHGVKNVVEDESLREDEIPGRVKQSLRRTGRAAMFTTRRNIRTLRSQTNVYARLDRAKQHEQVLRDKRERLLSDAKRKQKREEIRSAASRAQKKKLKKEMVQARAREKGHFLIRVKQNRLVKRRAKKMRQATVKKTLSVVCSTAGLLLFFLILLMILFLILVAVFTGGSEYYASAVTQNDYGVITDATGYFRNLETDLDEYLNADREALEAELEEEYGPDLYEYIYDLAEFGFSANTLMAYLSAVYGSFTLEDVQAELDSLFEEMYILDIKVELEDRTISKYNPSTGSYEDVTEKKKICYITLLKKELEEIVEARMSADQLEQYKVYRLSTGGQQVYSPVMREDWTNLISSNFGERIHPITKERKMHNGVDIAVPIGTHVYSAVEGTVILAAYSQSAGNWVKVRTDTGWVVVMMHMDSLTVSQGQEVKKGDHLGYSGNTGNSTGPHLHLEVRNPDDQPVNPIFLIPQTCAPIQGGEE